jgi:hypothetical protein
VAAARNWWSVGNRFLLVAVHDGEWGHNAGIERADPAAPWSGPRHEDGLRIGSIASGTSLQECESGRDVAELLGGRRVSGSCLDGEGRAVSRMLGPGRPAWRSARSRSGLAIGRWRIGPARAMLPRVPMEQDDHNWGNSGDS